MPFDEIVSLPRFDPSDGLKETFASYFIETFPLGAFDAWKHCSLIDVSAECSAAIVLRKAGFDVDKKRNR